MSLALLAALALTQAVGPTPQGVDARVEAPDTQSLLQGRQNVKVRWRATPGACVDPRFRVELLAPEGGAVVARTQLSPLSSGADLSGYAVTLSQVPVSPWPLHTRVLGCCGWTCDARSELVPVHTFLPADLWIGPALPWSGAQSPPPREHARFLGTDGRGSVWLYQPEPQEVQQLTLQGDRITGHPMGEGEPLAIGGGGTGGGRMWMVTTSGVWLQGESFDAWTPATRLSNEPLVLAAQEVAGAPEGRRWAGPCAIAERGGVWCRGEEGATLVEVGFLEGVPLEARLTGDQLFVLMDDGSVRLLTADSRRARTVLERGSLPDLGDEVPHALAVAPGGEVLWVGGPQGRVWRIDRAGGGDPEVDAPRQLPERFADILEMEADGGGRLGILTSQGLCTFSGAAFGCHGREHGWRADLRGLGWALPGVLWAGDTFQITAPAAAPAFALTFGLSLAVGGALTLLLAALVVQQWKEPRPRSFGELGRLLVRLMDRRLGWGVGVAALFLPQAIVLATDRLLLDLDLSRVPGSRVLPAVLFFLAFMLALHGVRSWADVSRLAGRRQLPAAVLTGLVWVLFLTLWAWDPGQRAGETEGLLNLLHLLLAVVTGLATLLYLFLTLGRGEEAPAGEGGGAGGWGAEAGVTGGASPAPP